MATPFSQYGVEIETMIVDRESLDPRPLADQILRDSGGEVVNSLPNGPITWSNELVMHVLEFKTSIPVASFEGLAGQFHRSMLEADRLLASLDCGLLGTAMHPWFDPHSGVRLWTHGDRDIYAAFDRVFGCQGHGWSNLQSFHLNLPFDVKEDDGFRRLHSAIRLVLPLVPVLAASSPWREGIRSGLLDTRLDVYGRNCVRIPSITGGVIPGVYRSQEEYREKVYRVMARDLEIHDPQGVLEPEWTNARGAIARFDRGSIEIRLGDVQESPRQDLAIIQMLVHLVRDWYEETALSLQDQESVSTESIRSLYQEALKEGRNAWVSDQGLLKAYQAQSPGAIGPMFEERIPLDQEWSAAIADILRKGNLAERLLQATGECGSQAALLTLYQRLRAALLANEAFTP